MSVSGLCPGEASPTEKLATGLEKVAGELQDLAKHLRRGEGDWTWSLQTLAARYAIEEANATPQTFDELRQRYGHA